jgi:hypothetical protein
MVVMAGIGFAFAWYTTSTRRARDQLADQTDPETLRSVMLNPSALPALEYLPSDVNVIAGFHLAECASRKEGKQFLDVFRSRTATPGGPRLDALSVMDWNRVDHAVLGVRIEDRLIPRFTLVVRGRYDKATLLSSLKAESKTHGKRTLYSFQPEGLGFDVHFWLPDDSTIVVCRAKEDFDVVPLSQRDGLPGSGDGLRAAPLIDRFNPELQGVFREDLPAGVTVWLAGAVRNGEQVLDPLAQFGVITQNDVATFAPLQRIGAWLRTEATLEGQAKADMRDGQAAARLAAYLARQGLTTGQSIPQLEANPQSQRLAGQLQKSLVVDQQDSHLTIKASCSMGAFLEALPR